MYINYKYFLSFATSVVLLSGCGGGGSTSSSSDSSYKTVELNNEYDVVPLSDDKYHIEIKGRKNLYLILTNSENDLKSIDISHNAPLYGGDAKRFKLSTPHLIDRKVPLFVTKFNSEKHNFHTTKNDNEATKKLVVTKSLKSVGDKHTFKVEQDDGSVESTDTTLKSKVTVDTKYGEKTLLVWVSDDSFEDSCTKSKCITQDMVDELQKHFLQDGEGNDIYDWDTSIYGQEWSQKAHDKYPDDLIDASDEINILFTDIGNDDNPNGGVMGYFYSQDNFKSSSKPNSNEMVMFYVDSVMFANDEGDGFWQKEMYSTLAHEFQHMIHFYQKIVLRDAYDDTWINELLSETTEDLVATKLEHTGPRNVDYTDGSAGDSDNRYGRYTYFNDYNDITISTWNGTYANYGNVNAFGAFLTRNYGGAQVLHDILQNDKEHEDAIEYATGKKFTTLLQEWGEAVILSSIENPEDLPTYNFGDFKDVYYDGVTYNLGSINFFNYNPTPYFYTIDDGTDLYVEPQSNKYYLIGENLTGDIDLSLDIPRGLKVLLVSKEAGE
jgi:hypothetical protein